MPSDLRKKVILCNQVILLEVILLVFYSLIYFLFGIPHFGIITIALAAGFTLMFNLNEKGHYDLTRFLCLITGTLVVFFYGSSIGKEGGVQLMLFPLLGFAFILFGLNEYQRLLVIALLAITCFIVLDLTDYSLISINDFTASQRDIIFKVNFVLALTFTIMCIYFLARVNTYVENLLLQDQLQLKQKEENNRKSNAKLTAILESTRDVIFAVDREFRYISFNSHHSESMKSAFGIEITLNTRLTDIPEIAEQRQQMLASFYRALGGEQFSIEQKIEYSSLPPAYFETTYNPIRNEQQQIIGVAVFSKDVTLKKQAEEEIIKAKLEAEKAARAKALFLSNMSHEIRTPMNAIIGLTDLLLSQENEPKNRDNLKVIKKSGENLLFLLNDILDISKMEAGKTTFDQREFDLRKAMTEVVQIFRFQAEEKGIDLKIGLDPAIPEVMIGDPNRLDQILVNLIGNAVKFTEKGCVTVMVRPMGEQDEIMQILFEVSDTGIGIPQDKMDYIFENFTQAFSENTRKYGGTGLGLAITKNLVNLQGGKISVESTYGQGSTFKVILPLKKGTLLIEEIKQPIFPQESNELFGKRIMVVDDNKVNQLLMLQILKKWNVVADTANNGIEALELIKQREYDAILMDLHMPEMNGFEATEKIRHEFSIPKRLTPIIAITADAFDYSKEKGIQAGMNDYITKPFKSNDLYEVLIKNLLAPPENIRDLIVFNNN